MKRVAFLLYAALAYAIFVLTFLYLMAFVAGLTLVPRAIDHPASVMPLPAAILVDLGLLALFGLQHSVMARRSFKAAWTRIVPKPVERSTYVVFTCIALILILVFWQPLPAMLWDVRGTIGEPGLWTVCIIGWVIVFLSTFLISHAELFGLAQAWNHWGGPRSISRCCASRCSTASFAIRSTAAFSSPSGRRPR